MTREESPYAGFLGYGGKTPTQWVTEFRTDFNSFGKALDTWLRTAHDLACEAMDCNSCPGQRLKIPAWFSNLTDIIALWCDVELHIDPTPLCDFYKQLYDFVPRNRFDVDKITTYRTSMTDDEIENLLRKAKSTWDRLWSASQARVNDSFKGNHTVICSNDLRDKWFYDEAMKGTGWDSILRNQKKKPKKWERIETMEGIRRAANRYQKRNNLPPIPRRQSGRKPKSC